MFAVFWPFCLCNEMQWAISADTSTVLTWVVTSWLAENLATPESTWKHHIFPPAPFDSQVLENTSLAILSIRLDPKISSAFLILSDSFAQLLPTSACGAVLGSFPMPVPWNVPPPGRCGSRRSSTPAGDPPWRIPWRSVSVQKTCVWWQPRPRVIWGRWRQHYRRPWWKHMCDFQEWDMGVEQVQRISMDSSDMFRL